MFYWPPRQKCICCLPAGCNAAGLQHNFHNFSLFQTSRCHSHSQKKNTFSYVYGSVLANVPFLYFLHKTSIEIGQNRPSVNVWLDFFYPVNSLCLCERHHFPCPRLPAECHDVLALVTANFHCHQGGLFDHLEVNSNTPSVAWCHLH